MGRVSLARAGSLVTAAATIVVAGPAGATPAAARATWHVSLRVPAPKYYSYFSAVTATGGTSAWAFEYRSSKAPAAYELSGSTWRRRPFPAEVGDRVGSASASSASNVWAFTNGGHVLRFNGTSWLTEQKFRSAIYSGLAISPTDVWVFRPRLAPGAIGVGTWHYDGHTWARSRSGGGLYGASALSETSIWGFGGSNVAHWDGRAWKQTSLAALLPPRTVLCYSHIAGIGALSAGNVYAVATGGCEDKGGPFVLLHYNGHVWRKVVENKRLGDPAAVIGDGHGGLWIPVGTGLVRTSTMEHFSHGRLSSVRLPFPRRLFLLGAAIGKRTTAALAVGGLEALVSGQTTGAVVLRFGP